MQLCSSDNYDLAYEKFVSPDFIHHNQYVKGDRESLMLAMKDSGAVCPNKSIEIKQIFEDGDTVITHSLVTRKNPDDAGIVVIHIWRFQNGMIRELWDVGQLILKDSPNEHGLF